MLNAFKNGVSIFNESTMNALISAQSSSLIFDGTQVAAVTGAGTTENNLSLSDLSTSFTLSGASTIGRIELDLKKYGAGADLTVEIRNSFQTGTLQGDPIKFPAKLFSSGYISLPIDLGNLTPGNTYWIILKQAGDNTNHLRWIGESNGSKHYKVFANNTGTCKLIHGIYGTNAKTLIEYNGDGTIKDIWRWLPASDGTWMICDKLTPTYYNGLPMKWTVS